MKTSLDGIGHRKKAQVTLFIIIGLIMLLILGTAIYFTTQVIIKPKAPTTDTSVQGYVQECIKQTGIIALKKIGDNGGYLSFENEYRELNLQTQPAEGDALTTSEVGMYSIPYWWYMKTSNKCNNCYLTSDNMPLIPEIEEQINNYIAENLYSCLKGFSPFASQYKIKSNKEPEIETHITKDSIIITAEYPVEITKAGRTTKLKDFQTEIKVKFKDMYNLASEIIYLEKTNSVIENRILHMLSAHMGASYNKLPPISEITHDYYLISWSKEVVKLKIKQILNSYIPLISFYGTKNSKEISSRNKYVTGFYNAMQIDELNKKYNLLVDVSYNDWPIYFSIHPEPLTGTYNKQNFPYDILPPFQTNNYEFYYDLSIPLLFQIRDPNAFSGEGYTLNFALETNIRDNKNPTEWNLGQGTLGLWDASKVKSEINFVDKTFGTCAEISGKYHCSIDSKKYDTIMQCAEMCYSSEEKTEKPRSFKTEFCSSEQKLSGNIKIIVKSGQETIKNAGISYRCGNYKTCSIGTTDENGEAEFKLSICYGGALSVYKPEYKTEKISLNTEINKAETINFNLVTEKEFSVSFQKMPISLIDSQPQCCPQKQDPTSAQTATLSIEKVKENPVDASFIQAVIIDSESKIRLVPGKYKVRIQYIDEIGIVIPAECKSVCTNYEVPSEEYAEAIATDILTAGYAGTEPEAECTEWMKIPEENIYIRPAMLGGAIIDSENGYWIVTEADINSSLTNINFYALEVPTPTCLDNTGCAYPPCIGLDEMVKTKKYSDMFRAKLKPVFT